MPSPSDGANIALELGEYAHHLKHRLTGRRGGIDTLLMQVQIDLFGVEFLQHAHEIYQRSAQPIDALGSDHIELATCATAFSNLSKPGR